MKILFAAGGTAGHVNPALAVAGYIRDQKPETQILFVGTADKLEARLVPKAGFAFEIIDISGFQRSLSVQNIRRNLSTVSKLLRASSRARKILEDFRPDVAVGFGGYVSGPVLRTAGQMGIPTAVHEQNAYPGVTNKALARGAQAVMLAVADAQEHLHTKRPCVVTGLPVREELENSNREFARVELGLDERPLILSIGGSLGARAINTAVAELMAAHRETSTYAHIHAMGQYGLWMPDLLKEKGVDLEQHPNIRILEYIDDMARCYAAADLVICRAGASTLSELQALGKPSILIPSPNVAENHQYHNAMSMVKRDAAVMLEEKDLTGEALTELVDNLLHDPARLRELGKNAAAMAVRDSRERIAETILALSDA